MTLILPAFFAACGRSESKTTEQKNTGEQTREEVVTVTQTIAVARQVPSYVQTTGSLVAAETSDVAPKTAGKVTNTKVSVGDFVQQGAVLAKLDENEARLQVREAEANVRQAEVGVLQAQARLGLSPNGSFQASQIPEVRAANASYEQAVAELRQAEANERRYRDLVETGDVSIQNYENYRTLRDTARARVNSAKQQLEAAANAARQNNQAIKAAQAAVDAARTRVATAQQAVADTIIRAPFSGFVSSRAVAVGEFVTTATPIITLLRTNPLKLQMQVGEADVPGITIGMGVSLEVEAFKDRKFAGTVTAINPSVDPTSRSAIIEASVDNSGNLLRSGMFATARIAKQGGNTGIFVPRSAVLSDPTTQSYRVFVIQEGVAKLRVVQLGTEENDTIQILNGVNPDEMVATSNLPQLYEGAKVQVQ
ncbi:MAG: efflux RND transporter periplasmic adaptor subunit [Acidobacteria bacterium]|nr:efflux RND transporter periplasmic adaptor subunit [Acidobacteriota bacterium]